MNLDDKLLGYRKENYCSSSEEEDNAETAPENVPPPAMGNGPKTGPKGVMQDYRRYMEIERELKKQEEEEKLALYKRLAMTCQSANDEAAEEELKLEEDTFVAEYHQKRIEQMKEELMRNQDKSRPSYGKVFELDRDGFLSSIDKDSSTSSVVIHIYDANLTSCLKLNRCLSELARHHPHVKFCKLLASQAGLSINFQLQALPTIQVYKDGILIGNYVRITDDLDDQFFPVDVENFLLEREVLTSASWQQSTHKRGTAAARASSDSDSD